MNNAITLDNARSYATEAGLMKALKRLGLDNYRTMEDDIRGCRYIVARTPEGRWTAIFLVCDYITRTGGYVGFASAHGFLSV